MDTSTRLTTSTTIAPVANDSLDLIPAWTPEPNRTLVNEWLRSKRSAHTRDAYAYDITQFWLFLLNPTRPIRTALDQVTLTDIQDYTALLAHPDSKLSSSSQMRKLAAVKSLFTFAYRVGALRFNVAAAQPLPAVEDTLAERILTSAQIQHMLFAAKQSSNPRNYMLLLLLYGSGCRCEEACNLQWRNVQEREQAGQITVYGKGRKTRAIPLHQFVWDELMRYRPASATPDAYVFPSRQVKLIDEKPNYRMDESSAWRVVKAMAVRAGIPKASTHWLRHAHATHAMDAGAPLRLIMAIMGHADLRTPAKYQHIRPEDSTSQYLPF